MRKLRAFMDLTRIVPNQIMIGIGVLIGEVIASSGLPPFREVFLGFLGPLILGASTFAMNDYCDLEADRRGGRSDRPLVRGDLSTRAAGMTFLVGFPLGLLLSSLINLRCLAVAVAFAVLALAYNLRLKDTGLPGNLFIASTMAIPFIYGSLAIGGIPLPVVVLALIAFMAGAGRELLKDIMDMEGDETRGSRSFPRTRGISAAGRLAVAFFLAAVALSPIPFILESGGQFHLDLKYMVPVLLTDLLLVWTSVRTLRLASPEGAIPLRRTSLVALNLGLLGFLLGSF
jgi:geranylgeranylglycerol-phosphate geranylgeranyltransferase